MKKRVYILVFVIVLLLALFITLFQKSSSYVLINGKKINVEIADSPAEMEKGLMHRENLQEDSGMLFVYPDSEIRSFWMKNTLIPLDIIFIDEKFKIVDVKNALPCLNESCSSYLSSSPAMYVLEVNSGYAEKNNLAVGDNVDVRIAKL